MPADVIKFPSTETSKTLIDALLGDIPYDGFLGLSFVYFGGAAFHEHHPIYQEIATTVGKFGDKARLVLVGPEAKEYYPRFGVHALPSLVVFKGTQRVGSLTGFMNPLSVSSWVSSQFRNL